MHDMIEAQGKESRNQGIEVVSSFCNTYMYLE